MNTSEKKEYHKQVAEKVRQFQEGGALNLPENYSYGNALKSAQLLLSQMTTKVGDNKYVPVLQHCTPESVVDSLLRMVLEGLNLVKKQCWFIVRGNKLTYMSSYLGVRFMAIRDSDIVEVDVQPVFQEDVFTYAIKDAVITVTEHKQEVENLTGDYTRIKAAYCVLSFACGKKRTVIMNQSQVISAWEQAQGATKVHEKFGEEMFKRTVSNRACKPYIAGADDSNKIGVSNELSSHSKTQKVINANAEEIKMELPEPNDGTKKIEQPKVQESPTIVIKEDGKQSFIPESSGKTNRSTEPVQQEAPF